MVWTTIGDGVQNDDELFIRYGADRANVSRGGEYRFDGPERMVEFNVDLTDLSLTPGSTILEPNTVIPMGARIDRIETVVQEVSAGTNSNLDLGLIQLDRTTEVDFNGLLAVYDEFHTTAIGTTTVTYQGGTEHGADLGEVTTVPCLVTANAETALFTDGKLTIRIFYAIPVDAPNL